jgi:hypothetical protein
VTKGIAKAVERYEKALEELYIVASECGQIDVRYTWATNKADAAAHTLAGLVARHVKKVSK